MSVDHFPQPWFLDFPFWRQPLISQTADLQIPVNGDNTNAHCDGLSSFKFLLMMATISYCTLKVTSSNANNVYFVVNGIEHRVTAIAVILFYYNNDKFIIKLIV